MTWMLKEGDDKQRPETGASMVYLIIRGFRKWR